jgi:hypothetical protein
MSFLRIFWRRRNGSRRLRLQQPARYPPQKMLFFPRSLTCSSRGKKITGPEGTIILELSTAIPRTTAIPQRCGPRRYHSGAIRYIKIPRNCFTYISAHRPCVIAARVTYSYIYPMCCVYRKKDLKCLFCAYFGDGEMVADAYDSSSRRDILHKKCFFFPGP